jgi:hypothetical protein
MSLTIDDETVRLVEKLAVLLRVDKIEAIRVALVNELRIHEPYLGSTVEPHLPRVAAGPDDGSEGDGVSTLR